MAADKVEGAEEDSHKEQKWQSFMQKHFGKSLCTDMPGLQIGVLWQVTYVANMLYGWLQ